LTADCYPNANSVLVLYSAGVPIGKLSKRR
jgi:hypothetical protein